jgi:glutathione S-transferase
MDACWKVQRALDEQGIEYEIVKEPSLPRSRRTELEKLSGQRVLPVIEFEDGSTYREESSDMAATVRAGRLFER